MLDDTERNTMDDLQQIEITIEDAKALIENRERLLRLGKNRDFKALIVEGYFKEEAARLVQDKPYSNSDAMREDMERNIDAIGYFRMYLNAIDQQGMTASRSLLDHEATRTEILEESAE